MFRSTDREKKRGRRLRYGALSCLCAVTLAGGLTWAGVPAAEASSPYYEVGFQANTGNLWLVGTVNNGASGFTIMPGTSPSLTQLSSGGYEVAFQDTTGSLITWGPDGVTNWGSEAPRTSPSISALQTGGYETAFQDGAGDMITFGPPNGWSDWGPEAPGTSPSVASLRGDTYEAAFQANTGSLWTVGSAGSSDRGLGMKAGTSPSIAQLLDGTYEVAFQANTGSLWVVGDPAAQFGGAYNFNLGMKAGTSPSITGFPSPNSAGNTYEVAFQANTGSLWTVGTAGTQNAAAYNYNLGMKAGTSPSIIANPRDNTLTNPDYEVAFQANTSILWTTASGQPAVNWGLGMQAGTSPTLAP